MTKATDATDFVRERLEGAGIPVASVELVSATLGGSEATYAVDTDGRDSDRRLYVIKLPAERAENAREIAESDVDVGIPEFRLLTGDPPLVVMSAATGKPLSYVLPVVLFPGIWYFKGTNIADSLNALGTYLARLHGVSNQGTVRLEESGAFENELNVDSRLDHRFSPADTRRIRGALERASQIETARTTIHADPTPHNLYYDAGDVELIDVGFKTGPAIKDVLVAEQGIELMVTRLPYGREQHERVLLDAFRESYWSSDPPVSIDDKALDSLRVATNTALLARYLSDEWKTTRARLTAVRDVPILENTIRRTLDRIDR